MRRTEKILVGILVINLVAIAVGAMQFSRFSNTVTTGAALQQATDARTGTYFVPVPTQAGEPYGDCFTDGKFVGYSVESTCTKNLGGNSWQADSVKKL